MAVKNLLSQKKGVAGLNVYLSLIAMLFMIGIIVMVFQIAGSKLAESVRTDNTLVSVANETIAKPTTAGVTLAGALATNGVCGAVTEIINHTSGNVIIGLGNVTQSGCVLYNATSWASYSSSVRVTYTYTYSAETDASSVINDTKNSIKDSTDFFPTFIVLGAMVVLVLLVVIIINSIRATGITQEGA